MKALERPSKNKGMNYTPWRSELKTALFCQIFKESTEVFYPEEFEVTKNDEEIIFFVDSKHSGTLNGKKCIRHRTPSSEFPKSCAYRYSEEEYHVVNVSVHIKGQYVAVDGVVYCCGGVSLFVFQGTMKGLPYEEDKGEILLVARM
jgi:hypothetical protein